ncbi:hypothetical protein ACOMHN_000151 [Nucella lapillus]
MVGHYVMVGHEVMVGHCGSSWVMMGHWPPQARPLHVHTAWTPGQPGTARQETRAVIEEVVAVSPAHTAWNQLPLEAELRGPIALRVPPAPGARADRPPFPLTTVLTTPLTTALPGDSPSVQEQGKTAASPAVTANSPGMTSSPAVTANSSGMTSSPAVTANSPGMTSSPAVTANSPGMTSSPTVTANSPGMTSSPAVTADSPGITSSPAVTANSLEMTSSPALSANSPDMTSSEQSSTIPEGAGRGGELPWSLGDEEDLLAFLHALAKDAPGVARTMLLEESRAPLPAREDLRRPHPSTGLWAAGMEDIPSPQPSPPSWAASMDEAVQGHPIPDLDLADLLSDLGDPGAVLPWGVEIWT